jgi:hypothetical protein
VRRTGGQRLEGKPVFVKNIQSILQPAWGFALLVMGIAFFFQIQSLMDQISDIPYFQGLLFFIRICLYLMSVLLVGGGIQKLRVLVKTK